jgi:hypothetical protein
MPVRVDETSPPTVTGAFDDAFSRVLNQLANDLTRGAHVESSTSAQPVSAHDLRRVARFILEETKRSSDRARKETIAVTALTLAQLAEKMEVDGSAVSDGRIGTLSVHDRP